MKPSFIVLSHAHWDHVSGLVDFPEATVMAASGEIAFAETAGPPAVLPGQVRGKTHAWRALSFTDPGLCGFAHSHDLFKDGAVRLVQLPGHTPGSVGMFVKTTAGRTLFFVGDAVWLKQGIDGVRPKPLISRMADDDSDGAHDAISRIHRCTEMDPSVEIVPAHDSVVQNQLGYYPNWIQ